MYKKLALVLFTLVLFAVPCFAEENDGEMTLEDWKNRSFEMGEDLSGYASYADEMELRIKDYNNLCMVNKAPICKKLWSEIVKLSKYKCAGPLCSALTYKPLTK